MPIPSVPAESLQAALARFDREFRVTSDWAGWENNKAHVYAIEQAGQHYPVKQIVALATGLPVSEFSGGRAPGDANAYVEARGFAVVRLREDPTVSSRMEPTGYWIFACNPRMWAIDRFIRERLATSKNHDWSIRPSDIDHFEPGQFGLVRVGQDRRTAAELSGAPRLQAGIYALCEILSKPFSGLGGDDGGLWYPAHVPPPGRPTVQVRFLWHSLEAPLALLALRNLRPDFNRYVLGGLQARSFPIPEDDFWFIINNMKVEVGNALDEAAYEEREDVKSERETLLTNTQVEEGYDEDRTRRFRVRNKWIISRRKKQDDYTCQVCQFRLDLNGVFIIDCHHKFPLGATSGVRITEQDHLICLCPTCHRIAHTRKPLPLGIEEIRKARGLPPFGPPSTG